MSKYSLFKFYTYDDAGCDIVVPVHATNIDEAWSKFRKVDSNTVDQVLVEETQPEPQSAQIVFNSQKEFEDAVMGVLHNRLCIRICKSEEAETTEFELIDVDTIKIRIISSDRV